ncbi:MAG: helix-turn-helix transcriptional regulator [Rhodosalinus sp.]
MTPEYLTPDQMAQMTGFSTRALEACRAKRQGPPFLKVGTSVRYRADDVSAWMEAGEKRGGEMNAPSSGTDAGGAGEDRAGHHHIIGDSMAPDAPRADQNSLGPDADAAVGFLEAWRPGGPWVLTAIEVDGGPDAPYIFHPPGLRRRFGFGTS